MTDPTEDYQTMIERRLTALEGERVALVAQSKRIEDNTKELLDTFNALKGAWKVLNAIGKLAKPLTFIATLFGLYYSFKPGAK